LDHFRQQSRNVGTHRREREPGGNAVGICFNFRNAIEDSAFEIELHHYPDSFRRPGFIPIGKFRAATGEARRLSVRAVKAALLAFIGAKRRALTGHFRIELCCRNSFGPRNLIVFTGIRKGFDPSGLPFSPDHQSGVEHDAGEPGRKDGTAFEISQMKISREHRILNGVFRVFVVSQNGIRQSDESRTGSQEHFLNCFPLVDCGLGR
jgi:hypothetical protein